MSREIFLENAENCMTNCWILLSVIGVLVVMVMVPAVMSSNKMKKLTEEKRVPFEEELRRIAVLNRYVLGMSIVALIGMGILFTFYQRLLPLPMEELTVLFNTGEINEYRNIIISLFGPIFLFLIGLVNAMIFIIQVCVISRQYTFQAVGKHIYKNR